MCVSLPAASWQAGSANGLIATAANEFLWGSLPNIYLSSGQGNPRDGQPDFRVFMPFFSHITGGRRIDGTYVRARQWQQKLF